MPMVDDEKDTQDPQDTEIEAPAGESEDGTTPPDSLDQSTLPVRSQESSQPSLGSFGDYSLIEVVGQGGMGIIYKAVQTNLNRLVALKVMKSGQFATEDDVRRFHMEARTSARLQHPNIVSIYDVGKVQDRYFIAMEFVDGPNLAQVIKKKRLSSKESASILRTLAEAIHHSHEVGILHRDLKPSNVLVDAAGRVKIADFGLAKKLESDSNLTGTGQIIGTPNYMSPEQAHGLHDKLTPSTDVYSLGAMLYEMLAGAPPFRGETKLETVLRVISDDPIPPSKVNSDCSKDLEAVCLKCLEKDAEDRYDSASDLADDLEKFLAGSPVEARRSRVWESWIRFASLQPAIASMLGMALAIATLIWVWVPFVGVFLAGDRSSWTYHAGLGSLIGAAIAATQTGLAARAVSVSKGFTGLLNGGSCGIGLGLFLSTIVYLIPETSLVDAYTTALVRGGLVLLGGCVAGWLGGMTGSAIAGVRRSEPLAQPIQGLELEFAQFVDKELIRVGDAVEFRLAVTNRGRVASPELILENYLPSGLRHQEIEDEILECELETIQPGEETQIVLELVATEPAEQVNRARICDDKHVYAYSEHAIEVYGE